VVLQLLFTYTLPFHAIFDTASLPLSAWVWLVVGGFLFFLVVEIEKLVIRLVPALRALATSRQEDAALRNDPVR
jgi:hypothetical protein